jgi:hypothetical protein
MSDPDIWSPRWSGRSLEFLFGAFENEHVTEGEWHQLSALHRKLVEGPA